GGDGVSVGTAQGTVVSRTRREMSSRLSTGHVVMVLAGALGVLLTLTVLRSADDTRPVLVAARDLAPGTVINDSSVHVARVHADASVLATLFRGGECRVRRAVTTLVSLVAFATAGLTVAASVHHRTEVSVNPAQSPTTVRTSH